ncbi:aldehyde dehydrogenase family protein [Rhodococcus opacus]|nr:aldehyde dehydrogenase family protein [Rhodococcus opacus]
MLTSDTLAAARNRIKTMQVTHFIDGAFVDPESGCDSTDIVNPADESVLATAPRGGPEEVGRAVDAARRARRRWAKTTPGERAAVLLHMADVIDANVELFAAVESLNVGKPLAAVMEEIPVASDCLRFMAGAVRTAQAPATAEYVSGHLSTIRREPVGVVGAVVPWNYPLMMAAWKIAPILAAGNTLVLTNLGALWRSTR